MGKGELEQTEPCVKIRERIYYCNGAEESEVGDLQKENMIIPKSAQGKNPECWGLES